jgi:hypothetical protein
MTLTLDQPRPFTVKNPLTSADHYHMAEIKRIEKIKDSKSDRCAACADDELVLVARGKPSAPLNTLTKHERPARVCPTRPI